MPGLILGVLGTLLGRIFRRFSAILCVVLRLDSGLFGPSVSGVGELRVAVRCHEDDAFFETHGLLAFHTVCHTDRSQNVGIRLHPQDWIAPSSADHGWLVPAVTNRSGLTVDLSQSLLRPTGADSRLICWYSLSAVTNRNGLAVDLSDPHCIFDTGMEHLPLA